MQYVPEVISEESFRALGVCVHVSTAIVFQGALYSTEKSRNSRTTVNCKGNS